MVQVTIAHHTSPSLSNLQPHSIYDFNGSLFESKYIFLYNTHHSMAFSLDEIWADFTRPGRTLTWVSNIYTHLTSSPFTQIPFYSILYDYHLRHNSLHIHPIFFHICYFNAVITFETHPYPRHYHLQIYSVTLPRQEHISIWVRFLKAFFFIFQDSMALRQTHHSVKYYSIPSQNWFSFLHIKTSLYVQFQQLFPAHYQPKDSEFQSGLIQSSSHTSPRVLRSLIPFSHPTHQ